MTDHGDAFVAWPKDWARIEEAARYRPPELVGGTT